MKVSHLEDCWIVGLVFFQLGLGWFSLCALEKSPIPRQSGSFLGGYATLGTKREGYGLISVLACEILEESVVSSTMVDIVAFFYR